MKLKIALCQTDIVWGDKKENLVRTIETVRSLDVDIAIFPEMFTTGYRAADSELAETMEGETVAILKKLAAETKTAIAGSIMLRDADDEGKEIFVNRMLFVTPEKEVYGYDKRHLFVLERQSYMPGKERIIIEYRGFRILPLICYDLRFPVWSRGCNDFDLMIYSASWDNSRIGMWDKLIRARAIENQCYVAGVNRTGSDLYGTYDGHSTLINYFGDEIVGVPDNTTAPVIAEIDLDSLKNYRERFRAWEDGDKFTLLK